MYEWLDDKNYTRPPNVTFQPSSLPSKVSDIAWLDIIEAPLGVLSLIALQNVSLAALAILVMQEASTINRKKLLLLLKRLLRRDGLFRVLLVNVLKTALGVALLLAMLPVMLPFTVLFWATSFLAKLTYALQWGPSVRKVEGLDCVWGVEEEENKPFIIACLRVHGDLDLHSVQQAILTKILEVRDKYGRYKHGKFRQLFSQRYGYCCWRDNPNFDINNHVREIKLKSLYQGDTSEDTTDTDEDVADEGKEDQEAKNETADELLQRYVSEVLTQAMPEDLPQWEVLLVARDDGRYNVLMRIHHAIGDGVSLVRLCVEALVDTPLPPPPARAKPQSPFVRAAFLMWSVLMLPFGIMSLTANFDRNCLHGAPLSGRKVMTWSKGLPLSLIRQVKDAASTTVNDVLMTCLSTALAKHFTRRKENVKKVTVVVPVSFHHPHEPLALTNLFSIATVKLPVAEALTSTTRLAAVKEVMDATKKDPTLWAVHWMVKQASEVMPAPVASLFFSSRGLTLAASNVPGPQQEISIWGDRVEDLVFWVPNRGPVGVGVSFFSYKGVVKVGLNVDLALVHSKAEAQQLLEDMEEELKLLHSHFLPQAG